MRAGTHKHTHTSTHTHTHTHTQTCRAGINLLCMRAGFFLERRGATSRANRKYGSWSIAHGTRHHISVFFLFLRGGDIISDFCSCEVMFQDAKSRPRIIGHMDPATLNILRFRPWSTSHGPMQHMSCPFFWGGGGFDLYFAEPRPRKIRHILILIYVSVYSHIHILHQYPYMYSISIYVPYIHVCILYACMYPISMYVPTHPYTTPISIYASYIHIRTLHPYMYPMGWLRSVGSIKL